MDFCRVKKAGDPEKGTPDMIEVIITTHHNGGDDSTPLQMISADRLQHLLAIEAAARALAAALSTDLAHPSP